MLSNYIWFVSVLISMIGYSLSCETPPTDCKREDISFYLYTDLKADPYELVLADIQTIQNAPYRVNQPIFKFLIHGYAESRKDQLMTNLRNEYLKEGDTSLNVIQVDYSPLAEKDCYVETAFPSVPIVGKCCAKLIDLMADNTKFFNIDQLHVVGFSLGAQVAAAMSLNLRPKKLSRITGLDPAWPFFYPILTNSSQILNKEHANFVDVIHTNVGVFGIPYSGAHYDIYANNGTYQPGCLEGSIACSHDRAVQYFTESIHSNTPFIADKCSMAEWSILRICSKKDGLKIEAGEHVKRPSSSTDEGIYVFRTASQEPFAIGRQQS